MSEGPVKAGTVALGDRSTVEYSIEDGERVAWVAQVGYRCHHATTSPAPAALKAAGFRRQRRMMFMDVAGLCPTCAAARPTAARQRQARTPTEEQPTEPAKPRQNVKTGMTCPACGLELLLMTRRKDGRRFIACSGFYTAAACSYTSNDVPQHLLAREAGVPMLPLPGLQ